MAKDKVANYTPVSPVKAAAGSPTKLGKSRSLAGKSPPRKGSKGTKLQNKLEESINNSKFTGLATIVEMMMDINCPADLQVTDGLGADNMTCIIIEFNK